MNVATDTSETPVFNRRYLLAGSLLLASGVFARSNAAQSARPDELVAQTPVLNKVQVELLEALCDTLIPTTDTPGANEARVAEFIALILGKWCTSQERQTFIAGLDALDKDARANGGTAFLDMSEAQRLAYLEPLDKQSVAARARGDEPLPCFATLKELTLIGYYTSEVGCDTIGYPGPVGTSPGPDGPLCSDVWV